MVSDSYFFNLRKRNDVKKHVVLGDLERILLLQASAIKAENVEDIEFYSLLAREKAESLCSLEAVISRFDESFPADEFSGTGVAARERSFKNRYKKITILYRMNMKALENFMNTIRRQLSSVRLLTKGNVQYNSTSVPEYIDIKR